MNDREHTVYILTNQRRTVVYIGVTSDLPRRLEEHHLGKPRGFAWRYNCNTLVFAEHFQRALDAIAFEKKLKGGTRAKKDALIAGRNPEWHDLSKPAPALVAAEI